jgi:2-keto-4-pentenoate hydratase
MNRDQLIATLNTNPRAVHAALTTLHAAQTTDEQSAHATTHHNGVGFNAADAAFLSSLASQVEQGRRLSGRQLYTARCALPKYAGQLLASTVDWGRFTSTRRDPDELAAMERLAKELQEAST